jgi:hypothetical protein
MPTGLQFETHRAIRWETEIPWLNQSLPPQLPRSWQVIEQREDGVLCVDNEMFIVNSFSAGLDRLGRPQLVNGKMPSGLFNRLASWPGLRVIVTAALEFDGKRWIHMAVSRLKSRPSHHDLVLAKNMFLGADAIAFQIYPSIEEESRTDINTIYLYKCLDEQPIPRFKTLLGVHLRTGIELP